MSDDRTRRGLAEDYLAEVLSPAEGEEYARLLLRDDEAIRELLAASSRELSLRSALQATAGLKTRRKGRRGEVPRAPRYRWVIAAAAAALAAAGLYAILSSPGEPADPQSAASDRRTPAPKPMPERPRAPEPLPRQSAPSPTSAPEVPSGERLRQDRERIEHDLLEARARAESNPVLPKPEVPATPPAPPAPPESPKPDRRPEPNPAPPPVRPEPATEAAVARIDALTGNARLLIKGSSVPASARSDLHPGQGLETQGKATLTFSFPDGSRFELAPGTLVSQIQSDGGKKILLEKGTLSGVVSKQPKDQPLVIVTPHGDARVLGTVLKLHVDPDPRKGTKLDVTEGKVELRSPAGKKVVVEAGNTATAAAGAPLVSQYLELDGWLRNVRNAAGSTGYGELEIADDPLEAGKKCFRLSYPTTLQGLVLPLPAKIPLSEFEGLACEVYIPNDSPKGIVFDSEVADPKNSFSIANQISVKRGSWQPVTFKPSDYKGLNQLDGFVVRVYICEILPGVAADAAPTHTVYLRRVQIKRTPPGK